MTRNNIFMIPFVMAACTTVTPMTSSNEIFNSPSSYAGRTVRVCGFVSGRENIWQRAPEIPGNLGPGLSIVDQNRIMDASRRNGCIVGEIVYVGCGGENICLHNQFEYGVIPARVE